jgi:hypothetical protein
VGDVATSRIETRSTQRPSPATGDGLFDFQEDVSMKSPQHEQSPPQNEATPSTSAPWVREPDEAEKRAKQSQSAREEAQLLDEPGYGYGV